MNAVAAAVLSAAAAIYLAKSPSYGCSSRAQVVKLQSVRGDSKAPEFQRMLTEQVAYGQCVTIPMGAEVEGTNADAETSTMLVNSRGDPPGYVVPLGDFKPK
jgi:hypothetical protein